MKVSIHGIEKVRVWFLPVKTRVPLKFGPETLTEVTCARVSLQVRGADGMVVEGWGETPLSVQWVWPSHLPYTTRHELLKAFTLDLAQAWGSWPAQGHALETGYDFIQELPGKLADFNELKVQTTLQPAKYEPLPWLAALVCNSAFDIALHDAYGKLANLPVYETYGRDFVSRDLASFLEPADPAVSFHAQFPDHYLVKNPPASLPAWHLVGGLDALEPAELSPDGPDDGHPLLLKDWITQDGLRCLKVKLRGNDELWDFARLCKVGRLGLDHDVQWFSADFNCTVRDPCYVNDILDRLKTDEPEIFSRILYVEQPFPYDLERDRLDVHSVARRKPLFLDESAHDWHMIRLGRELGWNGVALKTCKTQTGAILSACWAKAHKMELMVQDLTNPMLAQIPHVLLAANVGTIMGVETNAMQFYPAASEAEAAVHPGLYQRREGKVNLGTISGTGFGYRCEKMRRQLPSPAFQTGQ